MPERRCEWCDRPLSGQQKRYCSATCKTRVRREDPASAEQDRAIARRWKAAHREQNRARDRASQHRPCPHCGQPHNRQRRICIGCFRAVSAVRRSLVEGMWADGWSGREIEAVLGVNCGGKYVASRRADGWDVPRRYPVDENGRRVAA